MIPYVQYNVLHQLAGGPERSGRWHDTDATTSTVAEPDTTFKTYNVWKGLFPSKGGCLQFLLGESMFMNNKKTADVHVDLSGGEKT